MPFLGAAVLGVFKKPVPMALLLIAGGFGQDAGDHAALITGVISAGTASSTVLHRSRRGNVLLSEDSGDFRRTVSGKAEIENLADHRSRFLVNDKGTVFTLEISIERLAG